MTLLSRSFVRTRVTLAAALNVCAQDSASSQHVDAAASDANEQRFISTMIRR
jgi:hypothetical protein